VILKVRSFQAHFSSFNLIVVRFKLKGDFSGSTRIKEFPNQVWWVRVLLTQALVFRTAYARLVSASIHRPATPTHTSFRLKRGVVGPNSRRFSVWKPVHTVAHAVVREVAHEFLYLEPSTIGIFNEPELGLEVVDDFQRSQDDSVRPFNVWGFRVLEAVPQTRVFGTRDTRPYHVEVSLRKCRSIIPFHDVRQNGRLEEFSGNVE